MPEKENDKKKDEPSLKELIDKLKENILVEGTRKADEEDLESIIKHWLNEDKKH